MSAQRSRTGATDYGKYQQKRRELALAKQREARKARTELARSLHQLLSQPDDVDIHEAPGCEGGTAAAPGSETRHQARSHRQKRAQNIAGLHPREFYAKQLMQPEWMSDIPEDLGANWIVMPRPEGPRCLVTTSRGWTTSRTRAGAVLHRFHAALPEGSPATQSSPAHSCVLDCVFSEALGLYLILDVIAWRGQQLQDCTADFRRFWLDGTVREDLAAAAAALAQHQQQLPPPAAADEMMHDAGAGAAHQAAPVVYPFDVVPAGRCTAAGLLQAYQQPLGFARDGLYLLHAEGRYHQGAPSPLALTWKDAQCSRYCIDTDAAGVVPEHQQVTLQLQLDGGVATQDDPPVVLGRMPAEYMARQQQQQQGGKRLAAGRLLRFSIRAGGIQLHDGRPAGADLHYEGVANQRRGRADLISKIMFQYNARRQPLLLQDLVDAAAAAESVMDGVEAGDSTGAAEQGSSMHVG